MKYFKILILIYLTLLFTSCSTLKEGFINQKKNSSDEFLVEKKSPLVMPPDYDELLAPKQSEETSQIGENKIKKLVKTNDSIEDTSGETKKNGESFDQVIINKIKKN